MTKYLYVTGLRNNNEITTRRVNPQTGETLWTYDFGAGTRAIRVSNGVYIGGFNTSPNANIVARFFDGSSEWTRSRLGSIHTVRLSPSGRFCIAGNEVDQVTTEVYDSNRVLLWDKHDNNFVYDVAFDSDDNLYVGANSIDDTHPDHLTKYNLVGNFQWSKDISDVIRGVDTDSDGNIYVVGANHHLTKFDPNGDEVWSRDHGNQLNCIFIDSGDNIYIGGRGASNITHRKYNTNGDLLLSMNHETWVFGITADNNENIYVGGHEVGSISFRRFNSDGSLAWSESHHDVVMDLTFGEVFDDEESPELTSNAAFLLSVIGR